MDDLSALIPQPDQMQAALAELAECNALTAGWGLSLSPVQMRMLAECRRSALRDTGRVEFGGGVLKQLVRAFCASPYLDQENYADTLAQLQALFYHFKQESHDRIPDDELIAAMAQCFDGRAKARWTLWPATPGGTVRSGPGGAVGAGALSGRPAGARLFSGRGGRAAPETLAASGAAGGALHRLRQFFPAGGHRTGIALLPVLYAEGLVSGGRGCVPAAGRRRSGSGPAAGTRPYWSRSAGRRAAFGWPCATLLRI